MVANVFSNFLQPILVAVVKWFNQIVNSLSAGPVIIAAVAISLTVSFLIMPLRGSGLGDMFSAGSDYVIKAHKVQSKAKSKRPKEGSVKD